MFSIITRMSVRARAWLSGRSWAWNSDPVAAMWKSEKSLDYAYYARAESDATRFWASESPFAQDFSKLDLSIAAEIACGFGRHAAQIANRCGRLYLIDTSPVAIKHCSTRFQGMANVTVLPPTDGQTLLGLSARSLTAVFSYDSMVHFSPTVIQSYLFEIARTLIPGGRALLHHSNSTCCADGNIRRAPGWRNYMTETLFGEMSATAGLLIISRRPIDWTFPSSDALTMLEKP
jgi:SAM-dependent methyltransferase